MSANSTITEQDVRHVAKLARLSLSSGQISKFSDQLGSILGYIEKINELDLDNIEPLYHVQNQTNILREDIETDGFDVDMILAQAPDKDEPFYKVLKILGEGSS